jgi:Zn-dependent peptidase ImmA (M78 family)
MRTVRRRAERDLGVFAFQAQGVSTASMRGLSLGGDGKPQLLAVNGGDPPRARIFTLLHEMAHLATRSAGICDVDSATRKPKERFCNLVAACALMPEADVRAAWPPLAGRSEVEIAEEVGRRFAVTKLAFLVRVVDLGLAQRSVLPPRAGMSAPLETPNDAKPGRPVSFYRVRLARYGHRFMQTILRARAQGALSELDATRAIDRSVSLKQLQGYRDELSKQGAAEL